MTTTACLALLALIGCCALSMVDASAAAPDAEDRPRVVLDTTLGPITLELDRAKAPITVDNFLKYVDAGHFNGTIFHRVIPDFMIQGGGFTADMKEKPTGRGIRNEGGNGLRNRRGTIAMARTSDPNSATAQFFINLKDNTFLDRAESQDGAGYAVFGQVAEGMEVVDKIAGVSTARRGPHEGVPVQPIVINGVKRATKS
jgi:cyclophilin family peptidyl-prolyl cis-trans isomerase